MKYITQLGLICLWLPLLVACTGAGLAAPDPIAPKPAYAGSMPEPLASAVPVMACGGYGYCTLRPVNPLTGQNVPGYPVLNLGQYTGYTFSADRQTLALTLQPTANDWQAELHLVDLPHWQEIPTEVKVSGWTLNNLMAFSPDGTRLALTIETQPDRSQLALVDLATRSVTVQTALDFVPWLLTFSPDSTDLIAYGSTYTGPAKPQIALFKATDLSRLWSQNLPNLRDGEYTLPAEPTVTRHFRPAMALSPERRYLYLVHADEARLTTIDVTERTVTETDLQLAQLWFEQMLAFTAAEAQAKSAHETSKQAVISPDGGRLYVISNAYDATENDIVTQLSLVQVLDPTSGTVLAQTESEAAALALSADGRQLYLNGWQPTGWVKILDADSLTETKAMNHWNLWPAYRLDGQPILLGYNMTQPDRIEAAAFDPATLQPYKSFSGAVLDFNHN